MYTTLNFLCIDTFLYMYITIFYFVQIKTECFVIMTCPSYSKKEEI